MAKTYQTSYVLSMFAYALLIAMAAYNLHISGYRIATISTPLTIFALAGFFITLSAFLRKRRSEHQTFGIDKAATFFNFTAAVGLVSFMYWKTSKTELDPEDYGMFYISQIYLVLTSMALKEAFNF